YLEGNNPLIYNIDAAKNGRVYKPIIIRDALSKIKEGDYLIYNDCSPELWEGVKLTNEFNINVIKDLTMANDDILTAFVRWDSKLIPSGEKGIHTHDNFTLDSCIEIMKGENQRHSFLCASGMICIRKTKKTVALVDNWLHYNKITECSCM